MAIKKSVTTTVEPTTTEEPAIITPIPDEIMEDMLREEQAPLPPQPEFDMVTQAPAPIPHPTVNKPTKIDLGKWDVKELELGLCKGVVGAKPEVTMPDGTIFRYVYYMLTGPDGHPFMGLGNGLEATLQLAINQINEHYAAYMGYDGNIN